ncbi:hypothetical protein [Nocardia sp. CA-120079]
MSWIDVGLAAVIVIPLGVIGLMIFWPSAYDVPPWSDDAEIEQGES